MRKSYPNFHSLLTRRRFVAAGVLAPDLVVLTGDAVDKRNRLGVLDEFLGLLPRVPLYVTLGNWEHWAGVDPGRLAAIYGRHGGRLLVNRSVRLQHAGRAVLLTGLDDATAGRPDLARALRGAEPAATRTAARCSSSAGRRCARPGAAAM